MLARIRLELAELLYACAAVDDDPHMRRTLRRLAARLVPAPVTRHEGGTMPEQDITARFRGVENSAPATPEQLEEVGKIRSAVLDAALAIDAADLHPRYKATALTDLESAGMFAVKGVFAPPDAPRRA